MDSRPCLSWWWASAWRATPHPASCEAGADESKDKSRHENYDRDGSQGKRIASGTLNGATCVTEVVVRWFRHDLRDLAEHEDADQERYCGRNDRIEGSRKGCLYDRRIITGFPRGETRHERLGQE